MTRCTLPLIIAAALLLGPAAQAGTYKPQHVKPGGDWRSNSVHQYDNFVNSRKISIIQFPSGSSSGSDSELPAADTPAGKKARFERAYNAVVRDPANRLAFAQPLAAQGDRDAMYMLAWCYMQANCGTPADAAQAAQWLRKASEAGHLWATTDYATVLSEGLGVPMDEKKAFQMYQRAATQGDPAGITGLAMCYFNGTGVTADPAQALTYFKRAESEPKAQGMLGLIYRFGIGAPVDEALADSYLKRAAANGDARARAYYAITLYNGTATTSRDVPLARKYFEDAIARNQPVAMTNYAQLVLDGTHREGGQRDEAQALALYQRAAALDYAPAIYELAAAYSRGKFGLVKDKARALELARVAADGNVPEALDFLTVEYLNSNRPAEARVTNDKSLKLGSGKAYLHRAQAEEDGLMGYQPNTPTAASWFEKAAAEGESEAHLRLGYAYLQSHFGVKDAVKGRHHLQAASDAGQKQAHYMLGQCYEMGIGGPEDRAGAIRLYKLAQAAGNTNAQARLARLGAQ